MGAVPNPKPYKPRGTAIPRDEIQSGIECPKEAETCRKRTRFPSSTRLPFLNFGVPLKLNTKKKGRT